ncbi:hypothetical protein GCM10028833_08270 [Glycomyces tarimensis]
MYHAFAAGTSAAVSVVVVNPRSMALLQMARLVLLTLSPASDSPGPSVMGAVLPEWPRASDRPVRSAMGAGKGGGQEQRPRVDRGAFRNGVIDGA